MKLFRKVILVLISGWLITACFSPPEYPVQPEISFEGSGVQFVDVKDESAADSLILFIKFRDGDGDLGISSYEVRPPFNDRWYILEEPLRHEPTFIDDCTQYGSRCWYLKASELGKYISYADIRSDKPYADTLKSFISPYNCTRWEIIKNTDNKPVDTLLYVPNPHYSNISVELQTKNADGSFTTFDWNTFLSYPSCELQGFNGRFPLLNKNTGDQSPLEGVIKYSIPSPFFKVIFSIKTLRLKVSIEDRGLNRSNEIVSREFTLQ